MAWPTTPLTTYVANSTPAIKAADLNSLQDAINKAFLSTYSFKGLVIDGTGGAAVSAPSPAGVKVTASNPTSTTAITNTLTASLIPKAWARGVTGGAASIYDGANITSIANGAANKMRIKMASAMANTTYMTIVGSSESLNCLWNTTVIDSDEFDIGAQNADAATIIDLQATAKDFTVIVFGRQ